MADKDMWPVVAVREARGFLVRCMRKLGATEDQAGLVADCLVAADHRGIYSHGLNKMFIYIGDLKDGSVSFSREPKILKESPATAWVDGNNCMGAIVAKYSMDVAIKKAKEVGVGLISVKGSNHFGIAGHWTQMAEKQGLLGMAFCNTSPLMVPTRATKSTMGTNPISLAAPAQNGDSFVLDMATTAVAAGKVEVSRRSGSKIPPGWGCDRNGMETDDPEEVLMHGGLQPLGGQEISGGYKGYGLAMMVEVLCGILGGAAWGPNVRRVQHGQGAANLGHCFVAIDPSNFAPGFEERMSALNDCCRNLEPAGDKPVLIPGDPEKANMADCEKRGGIPYSPSLIQFANDIAKDLDVEPMKILKPSSEST